MIPWAACNSTDGVGGRDGKNNTKHSCPLRLGALGSSVPVFEFRTTHGMRAYHVCTPAHEFGGARTDR